MRYDGESRMGLQISKYLDGELSAVERDMLEQHLSRCSSCRELLQVLRRNDELLQHSLGAEIYGNDIVDRVSKRIREEEGRIPLPLRAWRWVRRPAVAFAAAAAVVAVLLGVIVVQNRSMEKLLALQEAQAKIVSEMQDELLAWKREETAYRAKQDRRRTIDRWKERKDDWVYAEPKGTGIQLYLKAPEGEKVRLWDITRRMEGSDPVPLLAKEPVFFDADLPGGKRVIYSVRPVVESGRAYKEQHVKVDIPARLPPLAHVRSRRSVARVEVVGYDPATETATLVVRVFDGRRWREEGFKVQKGGRVGVGPLLHLEDPNLFRTGWILSGATLQDQVIGASVKTVSTRPNWRLSFAPENDRQGRPPQRCWVGSEIELPRLRP